MVWEWTREPPGQKKKSKVGLGVERQTNKYADCAAEIKLVADKLQVLQSTFDIFLWQTTSLLCSFSVYFYYAYSILKVNCIDKHNRIH